MMKAIHSLSDAGHQSFVFTCRQREGALAKELSNKSEIFKLHGSDEAIV